MAKDTLQKISDHLFEGSDKLMKNFSEHEIKILERLKSGFTVWLDKPEMTDKQIREYMEDTFGIEKSQAYRDINALKVLLGNVRNATKEWQRYTIIEMLKKAFALAEINKDAKAMAMAADKIGKYTNLDKEDPDLPDWSEFDPPEIVPSDDVTILDLDHIDDKRIDELRKKYLPQKHIEDAKVIE